MKTHSQSFLEKSRVRFVVIVLTALMGVVYFIQITSVSARGYELKKLSDQKTGLVGETGRIELNIAEESSAETLKKRVETLGLTTSQKMEYLNMDSHSVAIK